MDPHMAPHDIAMFNRYIDNATVYLEFGSGGSTFSAAKRPINIFSVESDADFYSLLKEKLPSSVTYTLVDLCAQPHSWGHPGPTCKKEKCTEYSSYFPTVIPDLVLIDGRFRVACCLKLHSKLADSAIILFDDFLNRPQYHIILDYYSIIEKTEDNRMVALRRKSNTMVQSTVITAYELDSR